MNTKIKIQKKGQTFCLAQKENYVPFSNLSLCPKSVIALVQSSFTQEEMEHILSQLKTPTQKHQTYLERMRQVAEKQESFIFQNQSQLETLTNESESSFMIAKDSLSPLPFYNDYYK